MKRLTVVRYLLVVSLLSGLLACGGGDDTPPPTKPEPEPETILNLAFYTSAEGTGNLGTWADANGQQGLAAADAICQARATAGGLTGNFRAWLSDDNNDAYCRMHNLGGKKADKCKQANLPASAGPWVRTDGKPFAGRIDQLTDTTAPRVYHPIAYDESGTTVSHHAFYFTATSVSGELLVGALATTCSNWTDNADTIKAASGGIFMSTDRWTEGNHSACNSVNSKLLCMQTDSPPRNLSPFTSTGMKVFITSTQGNGNLGNWSDAGNFTGIEAGDAICNAHAKRASLSGNFKAWLSDASTNAIDRLSNDGPWIRMDGVKIADTRADLTDGSLFTVIALNESARYFNGKSNDLVWTGTNGDGIGSASNCNNWADPGNVNGTVGSLSNTLLEWTESAASTCGAYARLICFQD